jgi:hypothetical protein
MFGDLITNLPFDFCFYGNTYNQAQPGSNGLVSFDLYPVGSYCTWPISAPIPDASNPPNSIMGPFHDINPAFGGAVYAQLYGVAPLPRIRRFMESECDVFLHQFLYNAANCDLRNHEYH